MIYRIETERLVIRCYEPGDAPLLQDSLTKSVSHLMPWLPWAKDEPADPASYIARVRSFRGRFDLGQDYVFGIFNQAGTQLLGSTGLHTRVGDKAREIGYWLHIDHTGKGYITEAVKALIKIGFLAEKLERIEIHCDPENSRSLQIPQKLGFIHEATLRRRFTDALGRSRDKMIWTLFKEDFEKTDLPSFPLRAFDMVGKEILLDAGGRQVRM